MSRVVVIAAMEGELKYLTRGWARERRGGVTLWRNPAAVGRDRWGAQGLADGAGTGDTCVAACAGAGGEAALRALAEAEQDAPADLLVSVGWAGALTEAFLPGRAYRVSGVVDALSRERFSAAGDPGGPLLVSHPTVAGAEEKRGLALDHGAGLVDMEAAALARLAAQRGIPFYAVKGVSDGFSERLPDFSLFLDEDGRFLLARFVAFALARPGLWPVLVRLGRNSRRSAQGIAEALRQSWKV